MEKIPHHKPKTDQKIEQQIERHALFSGDQSVFWKSEDLLTLSVDEIKEKYPHDYQYYLEILRAPKERLRAQTRKFCFKVDMSQSTSAEAGVFIIKSLESSFEKEIAEKVADLGIGPRQYNSLPSTLREEYIQGTPLLSIEKAKCTPEFMFQLGRNVAENMKKLHENNILVNDQILSDDMSKSHLVIDRENNVRFVDFGASIDITEYPNISDEAVYSLMRTDPMAGFILPHITQENFKNEVEKYRDVILSQYSTKEAIVEIKDMQLLREGLHFLGQRLPNIQSFAQGVQEVFNS
jgi:tRNA A-37 threonylcarbamoyl transferase component Bud32